MSENGLKAVGLFWIFFIFLISIMGGFIYLSKHFPFLSMISILALSLTLISFAIYEDFK